MIVRNKRIALDIYDQQKVCTNSGCMWAIKGVADIGDNIYDKFKQKVNINV